MTARRIGSRPGSLPVINKPGHSAEPIPVSNTLSRAVLSEVATPNTVTTSIRGGFC